MSSTIDNENKENLPEVGNTSNENLKRKLNDPENGPNQNEQKSDEPSIKRENPLTNFLPATSFANEDFNPDLLRIYYEKLFPTSLMHKWLSYGDGETIHNREFSFTLKDDIYLRYLTFPTKEDFRKALVDRLPYKIDIGAVFNAPAERHNTVSKFMPLNKELVFDIDMTDYDDVRTCCKEGKICHRCWLWMTAAIRVVDEILRVDFGFRHLLWVYSGRRGVHCWVCDPRARILSNEIRTAVVEYMSVYLGKQKGNENGSSETKSYSVAKINANSWPLHPTIKRAWETCSPLFEKIVRQQNLFLGPNAYKVLLEYIEEPALRNDVAKTLANRVKSDADLDDGTGSAAYGVFEEFERILAGYKNTRANSAISLKTTHAMVREASLAPARVVLAYTYPRLDVNVSKQLNHLLKAPFCVHPKTGRVCVPIDPSRCDLFDPFAVPTLGKLFDELNDETRSDIDPVSGQKLKAWSKTSIRPHIEYFKNFVTELLEDIRQLKENANMMNQADNNESKPKMDSKEKSALKPNSRDSLSW